MKEAKGAESSPQASLAQLEKFLPKL